jgi:hypothetical protein
MQKTISNNQQDFIYDHRFTDYIKSHNPTQRALPLIRGDKTEG